MVGTAFAGKNIIVGVTGSIAAFKVAGWVSELAKQDSLVKVVMSTAAEQFVGAQTFAGLSGNRVYRQMFDENTDEVMAHIDLGRDADLVLIAPASANTIAKLAAGQADNLLCALVLATRAPVVVCPAMNPRMFSHQATQENLRRLQELGYLVIDPEQGLMACKEEGRGRLPEWGQVKPILEQLLRVQDYRGLKMVVTAGPTREAIDPARYLSNRSSGRMGFALAEVARLRGADVTLVSGPTSLPPPSGVNYVSITSALEMHEEVLRHAEGADIIIKAAAVADFRPSETSLQKIKKHDITEILKLTANPDILKELGRRKHPGQVLVGFAAESQNVAAEAKKKLLAKNLDLIAANDITGTDTGFEVATNKITLIGPDISIELPHTSKLQQAELILDVVLPLARKRKTASA